MQHHQLIQNLVNEISQSNEFYSIHEERMESRNQDLRDRYERSERERESERREQQYKDWQREDLMQKLDIQERMGNDWGANRTRNELRNL